LKSNSIKSVLLLFISLLPFRVFGEELKFSKSENNILVQSEFYKFNYSLKSGSWDMEDAKAGMVLRNAFCRAILTPAGSRSEKIIASTNAGQINFKTREISDRLGQGMELKILLKNSEMPSLTNIFRFYPNQAFFTIALEINEVPVGYLGYQVKILEPMRVNGPSGGLFLGKNPAAQKILDNGSNWYLDFMVGLSDLGSRPDFPASAFSGARRSDWSSIIFDPQSKKSALAGFLTGNRAGNIIVTGFNLALSGKENGRLGISDYAGQSIYRPPLPIESGFSSEVLYLDFFQSSPFDALEKYADAIPKWNGARIWSAATPTGWNSWGEYIHDLTEQNMLENLEFAAKNFKPFGMKYFQVDDGYQIAWGDWEADPIKFPHGMKWFADQVRAQGMIPGIWIAPFEASINSKVFKEHPDWFLARNGLIEKFFLSNDLRVLDLTKPGAQEFLRQTIRKYVHEWGYKWIKIDFIYYIIAYSRIGDGSETVFQIYRDGLRIIKEEAGPDVFVLGVGVVGFNYGLVDGQRLGLDNMPVWNNKKSLFNWKFFGFNQGLVPTARVVARRYWLNYRVWINHPDLIFFNNDRRMQMKVPELSSDEALCFASLVGLSGGIVKIGDKMVDMTDREVAVIQKLLPVYPASGRPLDLFEKETPEIWSLPVRTDFDSWNVLGFFNWGKNWSAKKEIPEQKRKISVNFFELGLDPAKKYLVFDFWNEIFVGIFQDEVALELEPWTSAVLAVRELKDHPVFLSYNRHITQGAVEINAIKWDAASKILSGVQDAVPGFEYHLYFYQPDGWQISGAEVSASDFKTEKDKNILKLIFVPKTPGPVNWRLKFQ